MIYPAAVLVVLAMVAGAVVLPPLYKLPDRIGIVAFGLLVAYVLHRLAAVRLETDVDGLTVVNVLGRRRLEWAEVLGVHLLPGEPWLTMDLADGDTVAVMGIQGSDKDYARDQASRLTRLVEERSAIEEP